MLGFLLMVAGIVVCGIAAGSMFTSQIGWFVIGGGAIILGIMYTIIEYKEDKRRKG